MRNVVVPSVSATSRMHGDHVSRTSTKQGEKREGEIGVTENQAAHPVDRRAVNTSVLDDTVARYTINIGDKLTRAEGEGSVARRAVVG